MPDRAPLVVGTGSTTAVGVEQQKMALPFCVRLRCSRAAETLVPGQVEFKFKLNLNFKLKVNFEPGTERLN